MLQEVTRDGRYPNAINVRKKRHFFKKKMKKTFHSKLKIPLDYLVSLRLFISFIRERLERWLSSWEHLQLLRGPKFCFQH